jgi:MFS family permease
MADRPFIAFVLLMFGTALVMHQNGTALPLDMMRHGISERSYGTLMAVNGILIICLQPFITPRLARRTRAHTLAAASLLFGVGHGLYAVAAAPASFAVAIAIWTLGEIALLPTASAQVADLSPPAMRARYQGVQSMAWGAASTLGPLIGGALLAGPGSRVLWGSCFVVMALMALGHLKLAPRLAPRVASQGAAHG